MVATTTVNGHVSRAVAFQARMDIWLGVGRQTPWDEAQLTGTVAAVAGNFVVPAAPNNTVTFLIDWDPLTGDPVWTINVTLTEGTRTGAEIVNEINAEYQSETGTSDDIASTVVIGASTYLQIMTPTTGNTAKVEIGTDDMVEIGFTAGTMQRGYDNDPPSSDPTAEEVEEVAGYKKADQTRLVVPDADTAAEIVSTVDGAIGYDLSSDNTLGLNVDDIAATITVTFIAGVVDISYVVSTINTAYQDAFFLDKGYATADTIASIQVEGPVYYIRLLSPNPGGLSLMEITADDNALLGLEISHPDNPSAGHPGGSVYYRDTQWRLVDPGDAYLYGARWVYLEANLLYDQFVLPLVFRQVGWYSGLEVVAGHLGEDPLLDPDWREPGTGILEVIDNRQLVNRAADEYEKIKIIIEF